MKRLPEDLRRWLDATEGPSSQGAVDRLVRRVQDGERDEVVAALLGLLPDPRQQAAERLIHRVERRLPSRRPLPAWLPAAAILLLVVVGGGAWRYTVRARALHARLESETAASFLDIPRVAVTYSGQGEVSGTTREPVIFWQVGSLALQVEPDRGVRLLVETPDGQIRVTGTRLSVLRDALGTRVTVDEGQVEVSCGGGPPRPCVENGSMECLPQRPAGLLARARALRDRDEHDQALSTLEESLAISPAGDPARGEILALMLELYRERGDHRAADRIARLYLAEGYLPRAAQIREILQHFQEDKENEP